VRKYLLFGTGNEEKTAENAVVSPSVLPWSIIQGKDKNLGYWRSVEIGDHKGPISKTHPVQLKGERKKKEQRKGRKSIVASVRKGCWL